MKDKSHKTAMRRKNPSVPAKFLRTKLRGRVLDYGCGHGIDADFFKCEKFDPYWAAEVPKGKFDTITCTYVINTVTEDEQRAILERIRHFLRDQDSKAFVTVRRDTFKEGLQIGGTFQRTVQLSRIPIEGLLCRSFRKVSGYEIYIVYLERTDDE